MPIGTAVHERTFPLCQSLNYREWSGFYAVSVYETHHEHEYNAIRNAAALIDVTPLYKYMVTGRDATRFVNRIIARDINKVASIKLSTAAGAMKKAKLLTMAPSPGWKRTVTAGPLPIPTCAGSGKIPLGLRSRLKTSPSRLQRLLCKALLPGRLLKSVAEADVENLKYFRKTGGKIGGVTVDISRTGYTGDLGYEIWIPWQDAVKVWDALMEAGRSFDIHPAGMLALDVARIEAGLILADVDYISSKKSLIPSQKYTPAEVGLSKLVHYEKENFIGRDALLEEKRTGPKRQLVGLEIDWNEMEAALRSDRPGATNSGHSVPCSCARFTKAASKSVKQLRPPGRHC